MKKTKRIYEWTATGTTEEGKEAIRFKGEVEVELDPGYEHKSMGIYARRGSEKDALEAAYKYGIDPDTVEVTDVILIYE